MRHPAEADLALLSGGDLGFWDRWRVRRHVSRCQDCKQAVAGFGRTRRDVQALGSELPQDLNWNRLAQEMTGNIRVGLAAGEAIAVFDRGLTKVKPQRLGWHAALVLAGACVVFGVAFWMSLPQQQTDHLMSELRRIRTERLGQMVKGHAPMLMVPDDVVLEATGSSIQVRESGGTLSLMHPHSESVTVSVNMQGSAGARYVDADTGQVTINRVYYAEQ